MPVAVLGLFQGGVLTRFVRSAVLDVVRLDYVTTARAKGLRERVVIVKHIVRNALIPVVTLIALQMPIVFRSEEHTSELQSLMRISYAVFCLKKKKKNIQHKQLTNSNVNSKL